MAQDQGRRFQRCDGDVTEQSGQKRSDREASEREAVPGGWWWGGGGAGGAEEGRKEMSSCQAVSKMGAA